jgi:multiple sugar transport system substrate-binding protein
MRRRGSAIGHRSAGLVWIVGASLACLHGCHGGGGAPPPPPRPSFAGMKLEVGALGDPAILSGLASLKGEWIASRGGEIQVRPEPIGSPSSASEVDLLIFPGQELGTLVDAEALEVIPNQAVLPPQPSEEASSGSGSGKGEGAEEPPGDVFQYKDIAPAFREQVTKYGAERLALPLGGSGLVLAYRRDAFTSQANVDAARTAGIKLEAPTTWRQLDALAKFFQGRDWDGDGKPDHGFAAVLGEDSEGLGDATFLARAASLGQHRDQYSFLFDSDSMAPRINSPPFIEALREIAAWKASGPPGIETFDARSAREAFRTGKVAMLIDRAERAGEWSGGRPIGVAPLPGSERVFEPLRKTWETSSSPNSPSYLPVGGGWLIGVRRGLSGPKRDAAIDLAAYLASPDNVNRLGAERVFPMLPVRTSQLSRGLPDPTGAPDVDPRQWSDAVSRTLLAERVVPGLRIPNAGGYLKDLSRARTSVLAGKDPESALQDLAAAWTARTRTHGTQRQLWHYRRSLNALATLPQPPERGR